MTKFKPTLLPLVAMLPFAVTAAELPASVTSVTANPVIVPAEADTDKSTTKAKISHRDIQREMIHDAKDLARYDSDLGISDSGRFQKGFSMRGVEGNRVGIMLDDMAFPDFEENSLYARYGYFNNSRQYVDLEMVQSVSLDRGASSLEAGSGALGGAVSYRTLEASDLVEAGRTFGALGRVGYSSKNREWTKTVGTAWDTEAVDAVLLYSHHYGHELDSTGQIINPDKDYGYNSQHVDPSKHKNQSYLGKIRYHISPQHSIGLNINGQNNSNDIQEDSFGLGWSLRNRRQAEDINKRISGAIDYTYEPYSDWLNKMKITADAMRMQTATRSWLFTKEYDGPRERVTEDNYREFRSDFYRLSADFESAALNYYGEHNLDLKLFASMKEFQTICDDTITIYKWWDDDLPISDQDSYHYTIQHPVRTTNVAALLSDTVYWEPKLIDGVDSTVIANAGVRLDWAKHSPLSLNAPLRNNQLTPAKPKETDFMNYAFQFGLDLKLEDSWKIGYQIASGFRNPTASEMYFTYTNPYGTWEANPDLKPEKSLTQTISLSGSGRLGSINMSLYQADYRNFLMETERWVNRVYTMQMQNHDEATIRGIELNGRFLFSAISPALDGFSAMGTLGWSKGTLGDGQDILAIQPIKLVGGLDYEALSGKWGVYSRVTYLGRKKPSDAVRANADYEFDGQRFETFPHLNDSATLFDVFGWYSPYKNITLRAGVYNITNESYHTWDALRGINENGTANSVGYRPPFIGLERFKAPGRNFAVSMEIKY